MTVEGIVLEGQGSNDDAVGLGHGHGRLGAELVFLVGLTFVDAGPVSYTHLDVYKRQMLNGTSKRRSNSVPKSRKKKQSNRA